MIKEGGIYRNDNNKFLRFAIVVKITNCMIFGVRLAVTKDIILNKQVNNLLSTNLTLYYEDSFWKMKEDEFEENVDGYVGQIRNQTVSSELLIKILWNISCMDILEKLVKVILKI